MDEPTLANIGLKSNKLELKFQPPKTLNYELEFFLYESKEKDFSICSIVSYKNTLDSNKTNFLSVPIVFDYELSTKFRVQYKVKYVMKKTGFKTKEKFFDQVYQVPFPSKTKRK